MKSVLKEDAPELAVAISPGARPIGFPIRKPARVICSGTCRCVLSSAHNIWFPMLGMNMAGHMRTSKGPALGDISPVSIYRLVDNIR